MVIHEHLEMSLDFLLLILIPCKFLNISVFKFIAHRPLHKTFIFSQYEASDNTVATITYDDWLTRNGEITRDVEMLVTPNIIVSFTTLAILL